MAIEKGIGAGGIQSPMDGMDPEEIEIAPLLYREPTAFSKWQMGLFLLGR